MTHSRYLSNGFLIDLQQWELLKQAEAQRDRFDRTVEAGEELTKPDHSLVTSIPEPYKYLGTV